MGEDDSISISVDTFDIKENLIPCLKSRKSNLFAINQIDRLSTLNSTTVFARVGANQPTEIKVGSSQEITFQLQDLNQKSNKKSISLINTRSFEERSTVIGLKDPDLNEVLQINSLQCPNNPMDIDQKLINFNMRAYKLDSKYANEDYLQKLSTLANPISIFSVDEHSKGHNHLMQILCSRSKDEYTELEDIAKVYQERRAAGKILYASQSQMMANFKCTTHMPPLNNNLERNNDYPAYLNVPKDDNKENRVKDDILENRFDKFVSKSQIPRHNDGRNGFVMKISNPSPVGVDALMINGYECAQHKDFAHLYLKPWQVYNSFGKRLLSPDHCKMYDPRAQESEYQTKSVSYEFEGCRFMKALKGEKHRKYGWFKCKVLKVTNYEGFTGQLISVECKHKWASYLVPWRNQMHSPLRKTLEITAGSYEPRCLDIVGTNSYSFMVESEDRAKEIVIELQKLTF